MAQVIFQVRYLALAGLASSAAVVEPAAADMLAAASTVSPAQPPSQTWPVVAYPAPGHTTNTIFFPLTTLLLTALFLFLLLNVFELVIITVITF